MFLKSYHFNIETDRREQFVLLDAHINEFLRHSGVSEDGLLKIFIPHTTASVTINQNANPDVLKDLLSILADVAPLKRRLNIEGNSDAHFKSSLFGVSLEVPIKRGKMALGEWQGVFFVEFDGPRSRKIYLQIWGPK